MLEPIQLATFDVLREAMPAARVSVALPGSDTAIEALSAGTPHEFRTSEMGSLGDPAGTVRFPSAKEPAKKLLPGDVFALTDGAGDTSRVRAVAVERTGGLTIVQYEPENA